MQSRSVLEALQQEEEWGKDRQSHFMVACEAVQVRRFAFGQMDLEGFFGARNLLGTKKQEQGGLAHTVRKWGSE